MFRSQKSWLSLRLSDEELEYYGELYVRYAIRQAGVDFETFLDKPEYYLQKYAKGHPAYSRKDGDKARKGLFSFLRHRQMIRTSSK
jgi:hypothetical protein